MNVKTISTILVLSLTTTLFSGCMNVIINAGVGQPSGGEQIIDERQCKGSCGGKQIITE